ncbi:hypothetical protein V6N11_021164 [Hibiscus sabdariffa]|uniref:Uncharacterized protein n=2 Tax=Hibiscus sabdariffa TaxID=183260 RepID=A0ABR2A5J5_9ROSI
MQRFLVVRWPTCSGLLRPRTRALFVPIPLLLRDCIGRHIICKGPKFGWPRHGWLCTLLGLPIGWDTWPLMACAADARCARRGETVPPLASLNVAALAERYNFFWPVAVVDVAAGRLAWRPSLFFSWCASMILSMFLSLCFRATGVLAVVFLCFVRLGAVPSYWPVSRSVVATIRAEWSKSPLVCPLLVCGLSPWLALVAARIVADQWLWARHCPHCPAPLLALFRDISWPDLVDGGVLGLLAVAEGAPYLRFSLCSAWECPPLVCGLFLWPAPRTVALPSWPSTAARVVAARRLDAWLCPHGPALPHGCSWTGLLSRPGLMVG